jgi:hypothetical protein
MAEGLKQFASHQMDQWDETSEEQESEILSESPCKSNRRWKQMTKKVEKNEKRQAGKGSP